MAKLNKLQKSWKKNTNIFVGNTKTYQIYLLFLLLTAFHNDISYLKLYFNKKYHIVFVGGVLK